MSHIANDLISQDERKKIWETAKPLSEEDIRTGMFLISGSNTYSISVVSAVSEQGEKLPRDHSYSREWKKGGYTSGRFTNRECVVVGMGRGAPYGKGQVARIYRDATDQVMEKLHR